jgi:hypothetical protein
MDAKSTPGKIKRMVKYAMEHANYQGLMTGETIVGIGLLDGGVLPTANGDAVILQMVLFNYFKMEDKFSVFAELHQTKELKPVLVIIPACKEAERLMHMMNKLVTAFLHFFLKDAALAKKFIRELLCETCNTTLVTKIEDCNWDLDTQTIITFCKKEQDQDIEDIETATWYKQVFDLRGLGKITKPAATKPPKVLFNLGTENSVKTIHNGHLKPTFTSGNDDDNSEGLAPAANPRPAISPHKNPDKEATCTKGLSTMASPPQDEDDRVMHAAGGR